MVITTLEPDEDHILLRHYLALWESYGTPPEQYRGDAEEQVRVFINHGRSQLQLGAFAAFIDEKPVGSVACQLQVSPYPDVIKPEIRRYGYIWSLFVEEAYRGKGVAKALMEQAIQHLHEIGCTKILLHSSDAGEQLYLKMGFEHAKEMRLGL